MVNEREKKNEKLLREEAGPYSAKKSKEWWDGKTEEMAGFVLIQLGLCLVGVQSQSKAADICHMKYETFDKLMKQVLELPR